VVTGVYRDLFVAIVSASAALTGLLFVALSVGPRGGLAAGPPVIRQVRSAAALVAFTNALAVALYGLVPGTKLGYPAAIAGALGIAFTAGAIRSILASEATLGQVLGQLWLAALLLLIFGVEIVAGILLLATPSRIGALQDICYALVTSLMVGIARAWELIGERDTGLLASIAALAGRTVGQGADDDSSAPAAGPDSDGGAADGSRPGQPGH
jgi:hypothetical protein